tara:strand:- start:521 stop:838 length:318 start_codon:yes stop_codon:yes gene_type:complete
MLFAILNSDNIVIKVITGTSEYQSYYGELFNGVCIPATDYVGVDYLYEESNNRFIPPRPYSTWILDDETLTWRPPVPLPSNGPSEPLQWSDEEYLRDNTKGWIPK